jgi:hypothetical protein
MDPDIFDRLTRSLTTAPTRRAAFRLLAVLGLGGASIPGTTFAAKKGKGKKKKKNPQPNPEPGQTGAAPLPPPPPALPPGQPPPPASPPVSPPCPRNCSGRECGSDGCDGQCGTCRGVERCQDHQCVCDAPGPGEICSSAAECCAYTELDERGCAFGEGPCSSIFRTCRYGLGGRCHDSCDCLGDLICANGSCVCPDGRAYLARGACCAVGVSPCMGSCCPPQCSCWPIFGCRCGSPF